VSAAQLDDGLQAALRALAGTPVLLVACDYDGVIAPIVEDPAKAFPRLESMDRLRALATLPDTPVAMISGRALRDLTVLARFPAELHLVGSHGAEFDADFAQELTDERRELHARLADELKRIVGDAEGVLLESKPASIAVHVRNASPDVGRRVLDAVSTGPARWAGIEVTAGKKVLELAVISSSKGTALDVLRERLGATGALFVGDDVTDEKAFARLGRSDVGVKVGSGKTAAGHRISDPVAVTTLLQFLLDARKAAVS
jgi:trehalose-phosphatase